LVDQIQVSGPAVVSVWPRTNPSFRFTGCILTIWSGSTTGKASGGKSQIIHWRRHRVTAYIGVGSGRPTFSGAHHQPGSQRSVSCPDFPRLQPFSRLLRQAQEWFNGVQQSEGFLSSQRTITITVGASAQSLDEVKSLGARDSEVAEASSGLARNNQHAQRGRSTSYPHSHNLLNSSSPSPEHTVAVIHHRYVVDCRCTVFHCPLSCPAPARQLERPLFRFTSPCWHRPLLSIAFERNTLYSTCISTLTLDADLIHIIVLPQH